MVKNEHFFHRIFQLYELKLVIKTFKFIDCERSKLDQKSREQSQSVPPVTIKFLEAELYVLKKLCVRKSSAFVSIFCLTVPTISRGAFSMSKRVVLLIKSLYTKEGVSLFVKKLLANNTKRFRRGVLWNFQRSNGLVVRVS